MYQCIFALLPVVFSFMLKKKIASNKTLLTFYLVESGNDLIEKTQALFSGDINGGKEGPEVGNGREHDTGVLAVLVIQFLEDAN